MQVALTTAAAQASTSSLTVRQFQRAAGLALAAVVVGCLLYCVETCLLGIRRRLVENPVDVMMRTVGLAHFIVGWLFLFSSHRLRSNRAIGRLGVATAIGALLCVGAGWLGGSQHPLGIVLFYGLFLVHEVGDEAELFQAYGDGPAPGPESRAFLTSLSQAVSLLLIALLVLGNLLFATAVGKTAVLEQFSPTLLLAGVGILLAGCGWAGGRTVRLGRQLYGQMRTALALYQPLLLVYTGLLTILLLGSVLGTVGINLVILIHVTAWLVFAHYQLGQRQPVTTANPWAWLRSTPTGFLVLHAGVALTILILMGLRVYVWERSGPVSVLLSKSSFYYWSIMHICMSFGRPRAGGRKTCTANDAAPP